ncbi:MAG: diacylglycerol kinase family lipid kinase [Acidobacteria bacterium]|nr:diacylglycerol kinase family lipid kinase [Acidobacteriota bacterium]
MISETADTQTAAGVVALGGEPQRDFTDPEAARRAEVILNAAAGGGECGAARDRLEQLFREHRFDARVTLAQSGEEIVAAARRAADDEGIDVVVAGGGDGTINAVASQLVGTEKILGVLPFGTLNHFAKDLGVPLDAEEAARAVVAGRTARMDVGEVNGLIFLNNSSLGLYPTLVREREKLQERSGRGKWSAAFWAAITVLRRYPFVSVRLSVDGREMRRRTPYVFIGNNEYELDAFQVGTRARLDAGELCLHVTRDIGRFGLARLSLRALFGRLREDKDFDALSAREVWIETRHSRLRVATDGEVRIMRPPLRYRVLPGALRVVVPGTEESERGG